MKPELGLAKAGNYITKIRGASAAEIARISGLAACRQDVCHGLVSVVLSSQGTDMSVYMAAARNVHHSCSHACRAAFFCGSPSCHPEQARNTPFMQYVHLPYRNVDVEAHGDFSMLGSSGCFVR